MTKSKLLVGLSTTALFLSVAFPAFATDATNSQMMKPRELIKNARVSIMPTISEMKTEMKDKMKAMLGTRAIMAMAKLTAVNGNTLTVDFEGKSYTISTGTFDKCTTMLKRRFWGNATLSEFSVGDILNIVGFWTDDTKTAVNACQIRDTSIQKRYGMFIGEIKSVSDTGFVMTTVSDKRSDQTVTLSSATKIANRKGATITKADLVVGNRVRVRGLWDRTLNTITEVTHVMDFSLPPLPTKAMNPRGRETITPTASPTQTAL